MNKLKNVLSTIILVVVLMEKRQLIEAEGSETASTNETAEIQWNPWSLQPVSKEDGGKHEINCYANVEMTETVRCHTACTLKLIIDPKAEENVYQTRVGCDVKSLRQYDNISRYCDASRKSETLELIEDYEIVPPKDQRLTILVRRLCCWRDYCNVVSDRLLRKFPRQRMNIMKIISEVFIEPTLLPTLVFLVIGTAFVYTFLEYAQHNMKLFHADGNYYNCKIDKSIRDESLLDEKSIIDTKLKVSGLLSLKETAEILALLPEESKGSGKISMKTMSSEDSAQPNAMDDEPKMKHDSVGEGRPIQIEAPLMVHAGGYGHGFFNVRRDIASPFDLLYRLIEHGPYQYPFSALELMQLFEETGFKFAEEPSLLKIEPQVTIISDIRGRYADLHRWLQLTGWPPNNTYLFLGGIIDRNEPGSIECLALICALKCRFPKHVYVLRGIPETEDFRMTRRYHPTICRSIQSCINRMCSNIPFAAVVGKSILAVYGGFSPRVFEKSKIFYLFRPVNSSNFGAIEKDIVFNQPSSKVRMYRRNLGHSRVPYGYLPCWKHRLINLWSAPGFKNDFGAVLHVSKDLRITPILMKAMQTNSNENGI